MGSTGTLPPREILGRKDRLWIWAGVRAEGPAVGLANAWSCSRWPERSPATRRAGSLEPSPESSYPGLSAYTALFSPISASSSPPTSQHPWHESLCLLPGPPELCLPLPPACSPWSARGGKK